MFDRETIVSSTFVNSVEVHDVINSTNDRALQLAGDPNARPPILIIADQQTRGRGRGNNRWWFADGALAFSLLIERPATELLPQLSLTVGLAVCEGLSRVWPPGNFGLKWPNDVFLSGRKVCGVLIEQPAVDQKIVIGVGINVNNSFAGAPLDLKSTGVSLIDEIGSPVDRNSSLIAVLQSLDDHLQALSSPNLPTLWRERCILAGEMIAVTMNQERIAGRCVEIADDGSLTIETQHGRKSIYAGSVEVQTW